MSTVWDREQVAKPLNDIRVDNFQGQSQVIDTLPTLSIDIPDIRIINNLKNRIQDSKDYWDTPDGFNLAKVRGDNERVYLGKQTDVRSLYRFQMPYIENQVYIAKQSIKAYLTAREPQSEVSPANDSPSAKQFAMDLEKIHMAHSQKVKLGRLMEIAVDNAMLKRIGLIKFEFDPDAGDNGEIIPIAVTPDHVVIDKNARQGENPAFIDMTLKMSVNEVCYRWPEKKEEIFKAAGIIKGTYKQMEEIVAIHETYLTYYDKKHKPHEALVYWMEDVVLEKVKNPNWIYSEKQRNFSDYPPKPYVALNFDNDGSHWIDITSAIEQAQPLQSVLNKRGRQLMEVADKANGMLVVSSDSGLSKDDLQNLTGDPNQRLIIKTAGRATKDLVFQVPPPIVPAFLYQDKLDLRTQVANLMGAPTDFTGVDAMEHSKETLGEVILKKNQAAGRQDLYVRAIDRFAYDYFNMLTQMMVVWYNKDHYFVYNGGDGNFDYLVANRYLFENGIAVNVKAGSTPPQDKAREEAIALNLAKLGTLAPIDIYKMLHLTAPQKLYDNWAKFKADPMALARDTMDEVDQTKAYMAYTLIMNGETPAEPDEASREFILALRNLMLRDEFLKAGKKEQTAFAKYVEKAVSLLDLRTSLDIMSMQSIGNLYPQIPINAQLGYMSPDQQQQMMTPGTPTPPPEAGGILGGMPGMQGDVSAMGAMGAPGIPGAPGPAPGTIPPGGPALGGLGGPGLPTGMAGSSNPPSTNLTNPMQLPPV